MKKIPLATATSLAILATAVPTASAGRPDPQGCSGLHSYSLKSSALMLQNCTGTTHYAQVALGTPSGRSYLWTHLVDRRCWFRMPSHSVQYIQIRDIKAKLDTYGCGGGKAGNNKGVVYFLKSRVDAYH